MTEDVAPPVMVRYKGENMWYLRDADTCKLIAKQAVPFDGDYLAKQAEKLGRVLLIVSSWENEYRIEKEIIDDTWEAFITPSVPQGIPA